MNLNIQLKSFFLASLAVGSLTTASICNEYVPFGEEYSKWKKRESHSSCVDSRGNGYRSDGISQCKGDPTSISLDMSKLHDKQGCWLYSTQDTWLWDMQKGTVITFEAEWSGCRSMWTTPLWLTPSNWREPQGTTGEIDFLEGGLCHGTPGHEGEKLSTSIICDEHPGHPNPPCYEGDAGDAIGGSGYFRGKIDAAGTWTMHKCDLDKKNCHLITRYPNYLAINRGTKERAKFHFMSDLFNGGSGKDGGWAACGVRVNKDTNCKYTITKIKLHVSTPDPAPSPSPSGVCRDFCAKDWDNRKEGRHCYPGNMADRCGGCSYCHSARSEL